LDKGIRRAIAARICVSGTSSDSAPETAAGMAAAGDATLMPAVLEPAASTSAE
jgi:hypothetical protein